MRMASSWICCASLSLLAACVNGGSSDSGLEQGGNSAGASQAGESSSVGQHATAGAAGSVGLGAAGGAGLSASSAGSAGSGGVVGSSGAGHAGGSAGESGSAGALALAGSTSSAGAASGGAAPLPATGNGFQPAGLTSVDATLAYTTWKSKYLSACSDGSARVVKDGNETVSEGIGYGMLLAVNNADRSTFDALWKYYQARRNGNGLMNWKIDGCTTNATGQNGASDADLDTAMALVMADKRWSGYSASAVSLIGAIKAHELTSTESLSVLKPGDNYNGADCLNYSYFSPGYYRVFAKVTNDASWTKLADDSYSALNKAANNATGLVPNWSNGDFQPGCASGDGNYGYDAARTPWRVAVDYVWFGTPAAKAYLSKLVAWVGNGISVVGDGYALSAASPAVALSTNHNSTFTGAFSCAAMAVSQARTEEYASALKAIKDNSYYEESLRALYMLLLSGNFAPP
jgi:endo-1,4-beta-D-glucanase Y